MKRLLILLLLAALGHSAICRIVPEEDARRAGLAFFTSHAPSSLKVPDGGFRITESYCISNENRPLYYIFNISGAGYIIISADDATMPVLAYSFDGIYQGSNAPPQFTAWMQQYEKQLLAYQPDHNTGNTPHPLWENLKGPNLPDENIRGVSPLIYSNWNQNAPYNGHCPADPAGPGGHAYAGCVPVAMGQLLYYYRWPLTGTGSYTYQDSTYGTLSANFGETTYDWEQMNNVTTTQNDAIAELLYHLGVSCDLVYGPDGSGMYNHKAAYSLRTHFKMVPQTQYLFRDSTLLNWDSILIAHLDRRMPLYYAGWSKPWTDGHAFVCDGYQDSCFFHFNFGWGGQNNGYFYTGNLVPGGSNFNLAQEIIINAFPDTNQYAYPVYCPGADTLRYMEASLEDGSGPWYTYIPGSHCSWLINPSPENDSISSITLTFNRFQTNPGDTITIYDGTSETATVLARFSGDLVPPPVVSSSNSMFVKLVSVHAGGGSGFFATYKAKVPVWCTATKTIISDTAEVSDGSFDFNYHNNSVCRWILKSKSGGPLTIHFRDFDTEAGNDILRIYDMTTNDTLAMVSGSFIPGSLPDSITAPGGKILMIFMTNSSVTGRGWEIYYPRISSGTDDPGRYNPCSVSPNPASGMFRITVKEALGGVMDISLYDVRGKKVLEKQVNIVAGEASPDVDISGISPGAYIVRIITGNRTASAKLMIR